MAVVMDVLHRPTKPTITSPPPSISAAHDRNLNQSRFLPLRITTSSGFRLHRITSQLVLHSSKSEIYLAFGEEQDDFGMSVFPSLKKGNGCSWMQDNSIYKDIVANNRRNHGPLHSVFPPRPAEVSSVKDLFEFICSGRKIGFSAPQGCGKTTLVFALDYLFRTSGRKSATISIDDFYLTYDDQAKLRENNPGNALLGFRGNAGSHDLSLSVETLAALGKLTKEGTKMKLPRYDKSAYSGRGDRADPSVWPEVEGPLTVVLFEGWMLGFKPVPSEVVKAVDPQVLDFVSRYLPAYKAYLPTLYTEGPKGSDSKRTLVVEIDEGRNPILAS
ncbi:hypothetical protein L1987_87815 [Smallanthus sonchifolius]|nr:hypothetical protein L1987_87815 [Smallanthus sonchifolius]